MTVHQLNLNGVRVSSADSMPPIMTPLVEAAGQGRDLVSAVDRVVRSLGFTAFMYGASTTLRPDNDSLLYGFTTAPREWSLRWDQAAYIEVDPRIQRGFDSTLPFYWDQTTERGKSIREDQFLDDAAVHGIRSGVSFVLPDSDHASVIICFSSDEPEITAERRAAIEDSLGNLFTFGYYFHELFMRQVLRSHTPSFIRGARLSLRERQCLSFAARGLTTEEIAHRLGIKPRTAQFHFDSIRTKLGVATRQEAIAHATRWHLITV